VLIGRSGGHNLGFWEFSLYFVASLGWEGLWGSEGVLARDSGNFTMKLPLSLPKLSEGNLGRDSGNFIVKLPLSLVKTPRPQNPHTSRPKCYAHLGLVPSGFGFFDHFLVIFGQKWSKGPFLARRLTVIKRRGNNSLSALPDQFFLNKRKTDRAKHLGDPRVSKCLARSVFCSTNKKLIGQGT